MDILPTRIYQSELTELTKIDFKKLQKGKYYYIRFRNKDSGPPYYLKGVNDDLIGKVNTIYKDKIIFDVFYKRSADLRKGPLTFKRIYAQITNQSKDSHVWKKVPQSKEWWSNSHHTIYLDDLKSTDMDNSTTFYIDTQYIKNMQSSTRKNVNKGKKNNTRKL